MRRASKSPLAVCDGLLVVDYEQGEKDVQHTINIMPSNLQIEYRINWDDETFEHFLTPESAVSILKSVEDSKNAVQRVDYKGKFVPRWRDVLNGTSESVQRQKIENPRWTILTLRKEHVKLCVLSSPELLKLKKI